MRDERDIRQGGFTLLELLVVLSVLSVVTTLGVVMLSRLMDFHRIVSAGESMSFAAGQALEQFREDTQSLVAGPGHVRLEPGEGGGLSLVVAAPTPEGARDPGSPIRVTYRLTREGGGATLVREEERGGTPKRLTLRVEVSEARFEAASGLEWRDEWTMAAMPEALRMVVLPVPARLRGPGARPLMRFADVNLGGAQP